jgi:hypothetical protein
VANINGGWCHRRYNLADLNKMVTISDSGGCHQWEVVPQEVHSEEVGALQDQAVAAKETSMAEQRAFQESLADGKAREEGLAVQISELQSLMASLETSLGEQ